MGSTITDDDTLAHILNNVSKSYEGVVTNTQTTMRMHQSPEIVFDMKGANKKDDGMFLGMLECLEVKQEEAEADDHFAALFDCSVFLESNEGPSRVLRRRCWTNQRLVRTK